MEELLNSYRKSTRLKELIMTLKQREKMKNRFVTLCKRIHEMSGRQPKRKFSHATIEFFDDVIEYLWNCLDHHYSDPKRHYHNWQHIIECLELFDQHQHEFMHPIAAEVAIWFHDFVYETENSADENEEKSAVVALEFLEFMGIGSSGHPQAGILHFYLAADHLRFKTKNNILATKNHAVVPGYGYYAGDQLLICDIDLAVLGRLQHPSSMNIDSFTEPTYYAYAAGIRKEYEHVPPEIYCAKRAEFLDEFLKRPRIYSTDYFFDKLEKNARANIAWEIKQLRAGKIPTL